MDPVLFVKHFFILYMNFKWPKVFAESFRFHGNTEGGCV